MPPDTCPLCGGRLFLLRGGLSRCDGCGAEVDLDSDLLEDEDMGW